MLLLLDSLLQERNCICCGAIMDNVLTSIAGGQGNYGVDPLVVQFSAGPDSTLVPLGDSNGQRAKSQYLSRIEDDESEGSDAFEDEDEEVGPALVCSCTLGGPTVVIEAKTDKVQEAKEAKEGNGKEATVTENQIEEQDPFQEEAGGGSETEHPSSDAKIVRFEVTNEGEHEDAINLDDLGSPVQSRLIIQLPDSSPAPKIEIIDDPENPVSESDGPSNFVQTSNPKGEKEKMQETGKKEDVKEKDEKSKEKKSLMKKLLGCFSCCVRPQKKQKEDMVT